MNKIELFKALQNLQIPIDEEKMSLIEKFCNFLIEANQKTNLTAIKNIEDIYLKHIYDSLTLVKAIDFTDIKKILDIGSGAGFPGIILKIIYPNINLTLLDSNNKKTTFLSNAIEILNLKEVIVVNQRAENFIVNNRETFDLVVARAVANLNILSELAIPFVKIKGKFVAMKSHIDAELKESMSCIELLGGSVNDIIEFQLPIENSVRNLVIIEKVSTTLEKYPRSYDKILKNPLKNNCN